MAEYTEVLGNNIHTAIQANLTTVLESINDPRGRINTDNYIYQSDPRSKAANFSDYPIIYIEDYSVTDAGDPTLSGEVFNLTVEAEFAVIANDDSQQQKQWHDSVSDSIDYEFKYGSRVSLKEQGIGQITVNRNNRFTGEDRADQPIIRREIVIEAPMQIDYSKVSN